MDFCLPHPAVYEAAQGGGKAGDGRGVDFDCFFLGAEDEGEDAGADEAVVGLAGEAGSVCW